MCFSANASFAASAALAVIGTLTVKAARRPAERPLAVIPWLFAVQQAIEGVLWLSFGYDDTPALQTTATYAYAFFSQVLWPAWVPLAVWRVEPAGPRRQGLAGVVAAGMVVSGWLLYASAAHGVTARPTGGHIEYVTSSMLAVASTALYVAAVSLALLLSTHRWVRAFGAAALASFGLVYAFGETWLISVWCFAAACLSGLIWLHFRHGRSVAAANPA